MSGDQCVNVVTQSNRGTIFLLLSLLVTACGGGNGGAASNSNDALPQTIAITPSNGSALIGTTLQLDASATYSDGTTQDVSSTATWSSSSTVVATVSASGLVDAVALGNSSITATLDGVAGHATVAVTAGTGIESVLHIFGETASGATTTLDGSQPQAPPIQASDGNFYGTTSAGGANSCLSLANFCGTVYEITPAGVETVLYSFGASPSDGFDPLGSLIQAGDGNFYGTTGMGGAHGAGTVFKITPAGVETILYSFGASPSDGAAPQGSLIQASDGNFYGTTASGGTNSCFGAPNFCGTVFKITPSGVETVLHSFGASPLDGVQPAGGLIQASDGSYYGTTAGGGTYGAGTVFEVTPAGTESVLYSFGASVSAGIDLDGSTPQGTLIQGTDGNFYGTTADGGTNTAYANPNISDGCGTLFEITPNGLETVIYSFGASETDGCAPYGPIVEGGDGNFYGTTRWGGSWGGNAPWAGTAFQITRAGVETVLHVFGSPSDGGDPVGLIQASDGDFYGATAEAYSPASGGAPNGTMETTGIIFRLIP